MNTTVAASAGSHDTMDEFLPLVRGLQEALRPQKPSPAFRERLRQQLLQVADQRLRQQVRIEAPAPKKWIVGAVIGSALTLAGAVAYWLRSHEQSTRQSGQART